MPTDTSISIDSLVRVVQTFQDADAELYWQSQGNQLGKIFSTTLKKNRRGTTE